MTKHFKHITCISLAVILLSASFHFTVYKMECLISGNTQISLSDFGECNETTTGQNIIKETCCSFDQFNIDFDVESNVSPKILLATTLTKTIITNYTTQPIAQKISLNFASNLPPPGGTDLLKSIQVFRI